MMSRASVFQKVKKSIKKKSTGLPTETYKLNEILLVRIATRDGHIRIANNLDTQLK